MSYDILELLDFFFFSPRHSSIERKKMKSPTRKVFAAISKTELSCHPDLLKKSFNIDRSVKDKDKNVTTFAKQ